MNNLADEIFQDTKNYLPIMLLVNFVFPSKERI